jgi:small subunit ribosomal protein S11
LIGEKAKMIGLAEVDVVVKGVGAGRESAIRSFAGQGIELRRIQDKTPVPHNGVRPPKARRV